MKGVVTAAFNPEDGVIFPWPFLWGYAQRGLKKGIKVETFTHVTGFETTGGHVRKVKTDRGDIACEPWCSPPARGARRSRRSPASSCPTSRTATRSARTEPLKPFLGPLVSVLDSGLYFCSPCAERSSAAWATRRSPPG